MNIRLILQKSILLLSLVPIVSICAVDDEIAYRGGGGDRGMQRGGDDAQEDRDAAARGYIRGSQNDNEDDQEPVYLYNQGP